MEWLARLQDVPCTRQCIREPACPGLNISKAHLSWRLCNSSKRLCRHRACSRRHHCQNDEQQELPIPAPFLWIPRKPAANPQASSATAPLSRASRVPPASHSTLADPKNTPGNQSKAHVSSDQSSEQPPTPVTPLRPTSVLKSRAFPTKARLRHHFLAWLFQASATVDRAGGREMEAKKPFGVIRADPLHVNAQESICSISLYHRMRTLART